MAPVQADTSRTRVRFLGDSGSGSWVTRQIHQLTAASSFAVGASHPQIGAVGSVGVVHWGVARRQRVVEDHVVGNLSEFVSHYIERVVNERDVSGVDEMVADEYRGSGPGWPTTIGELRAFYEDQARERPDWRIDVQATVELGDSVVVQAHAHGAVRAGTSSTRRAVDWLTHYRIADWRIIEINVLSIVTWSDD